MVILNSRKSLSLLSCLATAACTAAAAAQTQINGVSFQLVTPTIPGDLSVPSSSQIIVPANPAAAYSNLANPTGQPGVPFIDITLPNSQSGRVLYDDVLPAAGLAGKTVTSIRVPFYRVSLSSSPSISYRLEVGFWNPGGPNGGPSTPLMRAPGVQAGYVTNPVAIPASQYGVFDLDLGDAGFVLPEGRFFVGLNLVRTVAGSFPDERFGFGTYFPPSVGFNLPGIYTQQFGPMPFGQAFGPGGAGGFDLPAFNTGLGLELVIPSPSTAVATLAALCATATKRRRTKA